MIEFVVNFAQREPSAGDPVRDNQNDEDSEKEAHQTGIKELLLARLFEKRKDVIDSEHAHEQQNLNVTR